MSVLKEKEFSKVEIKRDDVERRYTRGTGKGGQNKNKVHSCVVLVHKPTGISVRIDGRDRGRNEKEAWKILTERLQKEKDLKLQKEISKERDDQTGNGKRGEKRRTYRVRDNIVIDHITDKKTSLDEVYRGNINLLH